MDKKKKIEERIQKLVDEEDDMGPVLSSDEGDALNGYGTIRNWEDKKGRGFWGNSSTGYIYDEDL